MDVQELIIKSASRITKYKQNTVIVLTNEQFERLVNFFTCESPKWNMNGDLVVK
mgnify:CR=1 FL=1